MAQLVKKLPASAAEARDKEVRSLVEDPWRRHDPATRYSCLETASWTREPGLPTPAMFQRAERQRRPTEKATTTFTRTAALGAEKHNIRKYIEKIDPMGSIAAGSQQRSKLEAGRSRSESV